LSALIAFLLLGQQKTKHEVNVWVSRNIAPSSKVRITINSQNLPLVHVSLYRLDGPKWLVNGDPDGPRPPLPGKTLRTFDITVAAKGQKPNPRNADTFYSRQINLPLMSPGVYLLNFDGGDKPAWAVVNVTNLAVVVKRSPKRALVWVTDFKTGSIVPGAEVTTYRQKGTLVSRTRTGADGAAMIEMGPGDETFIIRRGADLAGVNASQGNPDGQLRAHFQTDRPIYRPGQKVSFKAILRRTQGQGYAVVAGKPCKVQIRDPKDNPLDEIRLTSTNLGSVSGQFEIPEEGMTGPYTLFLQMGDDTAYQTFTVAEYRKPEFKVEAHPLAKRYLSGDEVSFEVNAAYYFGAPVPQGAVHYQIRRSTLGFGGSGDSDERYFYSGDGNLYARDTYSRNEVVGEDTVYTDANGKAIVRFKADPAAGDSTYTISFDVTDGSRRQVQGGGSVPVYGASIRLGMSTSLVYATLGSLIPVTIRAVDLDGRPVAANTTLVLRTPYMDEKSGEWKKKELARTTVRIPASGVATVNLPAKEAGEIEIEATATDSTKHVARIGLSVYVAGNFEKPEVEDEEPTVSVMLDKRVYEPGQKAKAFVRSNHSKLPILLVEEGGDIWDYKVLPNGRASRTWTVDTNLRLSPNAYVSAVQWVKGQLVSGNVVLPVPDRSKAMKVSATPDKRSYHPGDRATYTIRTTDGKGKPLSAEVAMSVVDEAIYALSPDTTGDLYALYWGLRPDGVSIQSSAPEEVSGGAYQRVSTIAPVRQRFEDTAFWNPTVVTSSNGLGTLSFEMPGNLTTWRATARGVTADTSVGTGTSSVMANRPVMLRLATPRQVVQGDRVTLIGTVNNRSEEPHDFEVQLNADGVSLEGAAKQTIRVPAKGEGKVQWTLLAATIPASGSAKLTGQVVATDNRTADYADALEVALKVVPNGLPERSLIGGTVADEVTTTLTLPDDRLEPATVVNLEIRAGLTPVLKETASSILDSPRYGSVGAANQLMAAAAMGLGNSDKPVKESLALLSRTQRYDGWGRWESAPSDPIITARVAHALGIARASGIRVFDNLINATREAVVARYNATNLWEHRAQLAAALVATQDRRGTDLVNEVLTRGSKMSPYARARLADALVSLGRRDEAMKLVRDVLKDAPAGPLETFIPAGEGLEWNATDIETTSEALTVLSLLGAEPATQTALTRWLTAPNQGWRSGDDDVALVRGLATYLAKHPESDQLGKVTVEFNGSPVEMKVNPVTKVALARVTSSALRSGENTVKIHRDGGGEAFYSVDTRVYRPVADESTEGIRVLRRFEVKTPGGTWVELNRPVVPGEPVRCTAIAWGDDIRDAVKVVEPIPAGFEFMDDESGVQGYQEVRDGAVIHYMTNSGAPQTFRYYLRAESEGALVALPATAEYLRRPKMHGHTVPVKIVVKQ